MVKPIYKLTPGSDTMESDKCHLCSEPIVGKDAEYIEAFIPTNFHSPLKTEEYPHGRPVGEIIIDGEGYYVTRGRQNSFRRHFLKH